MKDQRVTVTISSRIRGESPITLSVTGRLASLEGERRLSYLEKDENGSVSTHLTLRPTGVLLERRGDGVLFRASFSENEPGETLYYAAGIEFPAKIKTRKCIVKETDTALTLELSYRMLLGEVERSVDFHLIAAPKETEHDG